MVKTLSGLEPVEALLKHVDLLRAYHRAGSQPAFGLVEKLFDLAADVRSHQAAGDVVTPADVAAARDLRTSGTRFRLSVELVDAAGTVLHREPLAAAGEGAAR